MRPGINTEKRPEKRAAGAAGRGRGRAGAFTVIEMLAVISILAILAAVGLPSLRAMKGSTMPIAEQHLVSILSQTRQYAMSQRTTVYLVFVPVNFTNDPAYLATSFGVDDMRRGTNLYSKQAIGYNFLTLRTMGDQPGRGSAHYLTSWRTLPEGAYIAPQMMGHWITNGSEVVSNPVLNVPAGYMSQDLVTNQDINLHPFLASTRLPFPSSTAPRSPSGDWTQVRYVGFDYLGRMVDDQNNLVRSNLVIPLVEGAVTFSFNPSNHVIQPEAPNFIERVRGNWTNAFDVVKVEWLTGRAHGVRFEIQ